MTGAILRRRYDESCILVKTFKLKRLDRYVRIHRTEARANGSISQGGTLSYFHFGRYNRHADAF